MQYVKQEKHFLSYQENGIYETFNSESSQGRGQ
jgi:hypothetical protein